MIDGTNAGLFDEEEVTFEIDGGLHVFQSVSELYRPVEGQKMPMYKDRIFAKTTFLIAA